LQVKETGMTRKQFATSIATLIARIGRTTDTTDSWEKITGIGLREQKTAHSEQAPALKAQLKPASAIVRRTGLFQIHLYSGFFSRRQRRARWVKSFLLHLVSSKSSSLAF
jgi:hypothetical protein